MCQNNKKRTSLGIMSWSTSAALTKPLSTTFREVIIIILLVVHKDKFETQLLLNSHINQ